MTTWTLRPGRSLALLESFAFWPLWLVFGTLLALPFQHATDGISALLLVWGFVLMGITAIVTFVVGQGPSIVELGRRDTTFWLSANVLLGLSWLVLRISLGGAAVLLIAASAVAAGVGAAASLHLARSVSRWPTGLLRFRSSGPRLECERIIYRLEAPPPGSLDGDVMTLPLIVHEEQDAGPYRSGPRLAHAPIVLRVHGKVLSRQLRVRALGLAIWSALSLAFAASLM